MRREEASFDRIYQKQYTAILSFAVSRGRSRADAEEIAAEAFVRLWDRWEEMAALDEVSVKKWLYVTAGNIVREYRRRDASTVPLEEVECVLHDSVGEDPLEEAQFSHYLREIERALRPEEWELFRLAFLEQTSYEEIMTRMGLRPQALRVRIHRLRSKLRPMLSRLFGN